MAADRHEMKAFYGGLKAVYGPRAVGSAPVKSTDGTLLTDRPRILERWVEYFQSVLISRKPRPLHYKKFTLTSVFLGAGSISDWPL